MIVGQGPMALAVGSGRVVWTFFLSSSFLFSFSLSLGDGPIQTEILSQRAVKHKTTRQPINSNLQYQKGLALKEKNYFLSNILFKNRPFF